MEKKLTKIESFINGFLEYSIDRLTAITRYNTRRHLKPQTVMQHLGSTTLIAMLLSDYLNEVGIKNNPERVLRMAIIHDVEEVISGDLPHDLKYDMKYSTELRATLNKLTNYTLNTTLNMIGDSHLKSRYKRLFDEEKSRKTIEAKIVKAADDIDVVIYARQENKLGNRTLADEGANATKLYKEILNDILDTRIRNQSPRK